MLIEIKASKVISVSFENVPSWNVTYKHWGQKSIANAEWRYEARVKCLEALGMGEDDWFFFQADPVIKKRALVIVNVYLPHHGIQDIHNTNIKPILDGFSDAGLWADDEWAWVPVVVYQFAGIKLKRRVIRIDVYDLSTYYIGPRQVRLPEGRYRNDG